MISNNYQTEIDDDTKCLMRLHEEIIPTPNLVKITFEINILF